MDIKTAKRIATRHGCSLSYFTGNLGMWTLHRADGDYGTRQPRDYYKVEIVGRTATDWEREVLDFLADEADWIPVRHY